MLGDLVLEPKEDIGSHFLKSLTSDQDAITVGIESKRSNKTFPQGVKRVRREINIKTA